MQENLIVNLYIAKIMIGDFYKKEHIMNKKLMMAVAAILFGFSAQAQTMSSLWTAMPDSLFPYLDRNARTTLVNNVAEVDTTKNLLLGLTRLDTLTADYIKVALTEASQIEIKRFANAKGDSLLAVVTTFYGSAPESKLDFYDVSWKPLSTDVHVEAEILRPDTMTEHRFQLLRQKIDPQMCVYKLSPDDSMLSVSFSLPMLSQTDKEQIKAILQEKKKNLAGLIVKKG